MTSLTSLIERIEAATEGSRELDHDIYLLADAANGSFETKYSTSIDAALSLLPEGLDWRLERNTDIRMGFGAAAFEPGTPGKYPGIRLYSGATPALTLLAAILRARKAAQSGQAQTEAQG